MKQTWIGRLAQITLAAAFLALGSHASAQSVDALLDKLVDKGILTQAEANQLREEVDQDFRTAYSVKSGLPEWVTSLKINGDVRGRLEGFYGDNPTFADRTRFRYRLRFGATALFFDHFEAGFRLTSSEPSEGFGGDPISGNTTFQDNASKKFIYLDTAYGKWVAVNREGFNAAFIVGKMENPFTVSEIVFDPDYTPEGLAQQFTLTRHFGEATHAWKLNLGQFMLDEFSSSGRDPWLFGGQVRWEAQYSRLWQSSMGVGLYTLDHSRHLTNGAVPNVNAGNTREGPGLGRLKYYYNPIHVDASLTHLFERIPYYNGLCPIKVGGDFLINPAAPDQNIGWWAGLTFGRAGRQGTWEVSYRYKRLEQDAWYEEFVDSDFGAYYRYAPLEVPGVPATATISGRKSGYNAGTGVKGHLIKLSYSPGDSTTLSASLFFTQLIDPLTVPGVNTDSSMLRLQVDAVWKF